MKVSTKGCYALQIMVDLALHKNEGFISLKNISERLGIETIKYLEQVASLLQKAGLIKSLRGNSGGYKLSKDTKDYTAGEILRVTEGDLAPLCCVDNAIGDCSQDNR